MTRDLPARKRAARHAARAARAAAADPAKAARAAAHLAVLVTRLAPRPAAGYLPVGAEIDPRPVMIALHARGWPVGVPVIVGAGQPLGFRSWTPDTALERGAHGIAIPRDGAAVVPRLLIVPLLAFDGDGYRLGQGGGYYDRTLAALRAEGPVLAIGLGYLAQQAQAVPRGPEDQRLDGVVTEAGLVYAGPALDAAVAGG